MASQDKQPRRQQLTWQEAEGASHGGEKALCSCMIDTCVFAYPRVQAPGVPQLR